jgi:hypothetical protein
MLVPLSNPDEPNKDCAWRLILGLDRESAILGTPLKIFPMRRLEADPGFFQSDPNTRAPEYRCHDSKPTVGDNLDPDTPTGLNIRPCSLFELEIRRSSCRGAATFRAILEDAQSAAQHSNEGVSS